MSIEKDVLEIGVTAAVNPSSYLYIGADSNEWLAVGLGYHKFTSPSWKVAAYYEYGLANDWLMDEMVGVDGVKTKTNMLELTATKYLNRYSVKFGAKTERIRNGFTWITVDDADKYAVHVGAAHVFKHLYLSGKYEHHYAIDRSDMLDFNQGRASEWELSLGSVKPIWRLFPYAKLSALLPHGKYYGSEKTTYSWTFGGRLSF